MIGKEAYRISELCSLFSIGRTKIYQEISAGRLKVFKIGRATLISREAAEEWKKLCESAENKMVVA